MYSLNISYMYKMYFNLIHPNYLLSAYSRTQQPISLPTSYLLFLYYYFQYVLEFN